MFVTASIGMNYAEACVIDRAPSGPDDAVGDEPILLSLVPPREEISWLGRDQTGRKYTTDPQRRAQNIERAARRSAAHVRWLVEEYGLDLLVTLTLDGQHRVVSRSDFLRMVYAFFKRLDWALQSIAEMSRAERIVTAHKLLKARQRRWGRLTKHWRTFLRRMASGNLPKELGIAVAVPELTQNGDWHVHLAISGMVPIELIEYVWEKGFCYISNQDRKAMKSGGISGYLAKYMRKQMADVLDERRAPIESRRYAVYPRVGLPKPQKYRGFTPSPKAVVEWAKGLGFRVYRSYAFSVPLPGRPGESVQIYWYAFKKVAAFRERAA